MAQIVMPQLGEGVTEGTIARWLKEPGEHVERYEAIAEVVTDKVNAEIPAPAEGVMGRHLVDEGAVVPVGAAICELDADGAPIATDAPGSAAGAVRAAADGAGVTPRAPSEPPPVAVSETQAATHPPVAPAPEPAPIAAQRGNGAGTVPAVAAPPDGTARTAAEPGGAPHPPAPAPPPSTDAAAPTEPDGDRQRVSPAVRMLAREHAVDLSALRGTGIGGRLTKRDVLAHVQQRGPAPAPGAPPAPPSAPATAPVPPIRPGADLARAPGPTPAPEGDRLVALTQARRAIAEHMVRSKATSPHAWTMVEVDMTAVARVRAREKHAFQEATGAHLTFLPFVARATVSALRHHPMLNSTWTDGGILLKRSIHLGIAVALEDSLIVPVIRDADSLNIAGLAKAAQDLGERARSGRLRIDDLTGGTFTLNNTGALGLVLTAPIINQPQAAILAMDAVVRRPVVTADDAIAIRSMMNLCISFDHRIVDGLAAARFVRDVKQQLETIDDTAPIV
ncbi:MAG TPA: dihydrolipoamide acetyltransferase family protein [Candidatus Dormibacteraeota bacterium]|nr:dihydrolipoamide acetyltransferase family protein [Candidatus Dormibacteraeota bacterium]